MNHTLPAYNRSLRLFPMHLSPIEALFLADDRPGYPMAFTIQLDLRGCVDRSLFESSLDGALERHPLLNAILKPVKAGLPCWTPAAGRKPLLDWGTADQPVECPHGEYIDLCDEVGLRIWVRQGAQRARVTVQFHHACTDGIGAYRFLGDLLALYGRELAQGNQRPELAPLDPSLLRQRKMKLTELAYRGHTWRLRRRAWGELFAVFSRRVSPLTPPHGRLDEPVEFPGIQSFIFDRPEYERLQQSARRLGVASNDLLLAGLLAALAEWNRRHRSWLRGPWLRIIMPTDMRQGTDDYQVPATNLVSYTFISRKARHCREVSPLVHGIRDETAQIKHQRRGARFNDAVAGACTYRKLLPILLSGPRCLATAVLSNVGDPSRRFTAQLPRQGGRIVAGNLVLEQVTGVPPMRPKTRVTCSIFNYLRTLTISMRGDPHWFRPDDTGELLHLFADHLRPFAEE